MDEIFDTLMEAIEESSFPLFYAKLDYRRSQQCALQEEQWLEEHLDEEARMHFEELQRAEFQTGTLEREALVRTAISVGIQFALPG